MFKSEMSFEESLNKIAEARPKELKPLPPNYLDLLEAKLKELDNEII